MVADCRIRACSYCRSTPGDIPPEILDKIPQVTLVGRLGSGLRRVGRIHGLVPVFKFSLKEVATHRGGAVLQGRFLYHHGECIQKCISYRHVHNGPVARPKSAYCRCMVLRCESNSDLRTIETHTICLIIVSWCM